MQAISSKLKIFTGSVGVVNNDMEKALLKIMLWSFAALALLYVLFLGNMVMNIVERKSLEATARGLESVVGNLELTYLSKSNDVDLALSYSLGFKEAKTSFTTRKSLGLIFVPGDVGQGAIKLTQNGI